MKNKVLKFQKPEITPQILDLFRRVREIIEVDGNLTWEEEGGRRAEFFRIENELDESMGRTKPWQVSPLQTYDELAEGHTPEHAREFKRAEKLRQELEEALDAQPERR
jgi:hypothetical protein